ncbi:MAG TPA: EAL domain-containing protein [Thermoanaerobaculia bacterium]|nr:EAL domain-containing protein [Thermoanaerobaculia bacterium]
MMFSDSARDTVAEKRKRGRRASSRGGEPAAAALASGGEPPRPRRPGRSAPAIDQAPAAVWTTDLELHLTSAMGAALAALGIDADGGASGLQEIFAGDREAREARQAGAAGSAGAQEPLRAHLAALAGESVGYEQQRQGRRFEARVGPLRDAEGRVVGSIGVAIDVSGRGPGTSALLREKERAEVTLASIGDGVIRTDLAGKIDYLNPMAEALTGWSSQSALGRSIPEVFRLIDESTRQPLSDPIQTCLEELRIVESPRGALLLSADGREYSVRDTAAPLQSRDGAPLGAVLVFKDVTELRGMEREMAYLASHDALTGLLNRREFEQRLDRAIRSAGAERRQHALLYLDLDEFKLVNDTCGHLVGDEMLRQVTALLRARVRQTDALARLGGDEFGVLLEDCPPHQARQTAEELLQTLREFRFSSRDQLFEAGVSIGLVQIDGSCDLAQAMSAADAACYVAKDQGRNRTHEYEIDDTAVGERYGEMQWIHRIHGAFAERRFRLFYQLIQPLQAAASGERELLCEIFLRMLDRSGQVIEPAAFVAAAERYHLATSLDRWVVKTAFAALAESQRIPASQPVLFAINLSGQSLGDESFLAFVVEELAASGVDPRRIGFEITETAAISRFDRALRFFSTLNAKGFRFILDDFGTGLSSFAYLRDLPVAFLKIDGDFVRNLTQDPIRRAMVESINQIGHVMGIQTIAEWVENRATFDALKEIGVDYAQGFWIGHPEPLIHDH